VTVAQSLYVDVESLVDPPLKLIDELVEGGLSRSFRPIAPPGRRILRISYELHASAIVP
jgi:hypothetical protein